MRSNDQERSDAHGSWPNRRLYEPRTISFDLKISSTTQSQAEGDIYALGNAFLLGEGQRQFVWQRPNGFGKRFCWAYVDATDADADYMVAKGLTTCSVQLVANDPRIYGITTTTTNFSLATNVETGNTSVTNAGNTNSFPTFEIDGPFTNPVITNAADSNKQIKLTCAIAAGTTLRVDTKLMTIETKTGAGAWVDHFEYLANDSDWWTLQPGSNIITYTRASTNKGAASAFRLLWESAWMN